MEQVIEKIIFNDWKDCLRVTHNDIELIVSTSFGPRILSFRLTGQKNVFYLEKNQPRSKANDKWKIYGGHRLWHAPEVMPRTYSPDNDPVTVATIEDGLLITQKPEAITGIQKQLEIIFLTGQKIVQVTHRLTNVGSWPIELAPWALSVLAGSGTIIMPDNASQPGDTLQSNRTIALWPGTNLGDKRWKWQEKYMFASFDPAYQSEQKLGFSNPAGWMAYCLDDQVLIKTFSYDPLATYPDRGSNTEIYIDGRFIEMETLGPLSSLNPQSSTEHTEYWTLEKLTFKMAPASIDKHLLPVVNKMKNSILN